MDCVTKRNHKIGFPPCTMVILGTANGLSKFCRYLAFVVWAERHRDWVQTVLSVLPISALSHPAFPPQPTHHNGALKYTFSCKTAVISVIRDSSYQIAKSHFFLPIAFLSSHSILKKCFFFPKPLWLCTLLLASSFTWLDYLWGKYLVSTRQWLLLGTSLTSERRSSALHYPISNPLLEQPRAITWFQMPSVPCLLPNLHPQPSPHSGTQNSCI